MVATVVGGVLAAFIVIWLAGGSAPDADERAAKPAPGDGELSCQPTTEFRGFNDSLPPGAEVVQPDEYLSGAYDGQIEQGDILRVRAAGDKRADFADSVTVKAGSSVMVGLRLHNPGPGSVGEVKARVALPGRADNALELKAIVSWYGIAGADETTDTATILVAPSSSVEAVGESRACARYIPQSTEERLGPDGPREAVSLDWITADAGAYWGEIGDDRSDVVFVYFKVVVI